MSANPPGFVIELLLATGDPIVGDVSEADVLKYQLGIEGAVGFTQEPANDRERAMSIIAVGLDYHMNREDGLFGMNDREGRFCIVRCDRIIAALIADPADPSAGRRVGFGKRDADGQAPGPSRESREDPRG